MIKKIYNILIQHEWFREFFDEDTYFLIIIDEKKIWIHADDFVKGQFIKRVDGRWNTQFFCSECKNELVHSQSFISEENTDTKLIAEYLCSHCKKHQYGNFGIIPGALHCDKEGNLID